MVATIILSILIFGAAGFVVYRQVKKGSSCEDCKTSRPVKKPDQNNLLLNENKKREVLRIVFPSHFSFFEMKFNCRSKF